MNQINEAINEYFLRNPISVLKIKFDYKQHNRVKLLDDTTKDAYILDINLAKLYIEKLKIK